MSIADSAAVPEALYNRYRPRRLSELVGQDHVTVPLRRAFENGRIHHAYLLSGPRGCGKTSTARILAAGLVCDTGPTADPCNTCDQCTQVISGSHIDVIEMDAASNGGVDDARELRERAHFSPAIARYKVIVVDEAHMVSAAGFNALLKLIEEPPAHVRFIFATTNPEKVLGTIRSRTYHYSFRLVPAPALAEHLTSVVAKEGYQVEDGVLPLVLRAGGGSMRDSLAVLGQLLDGAENQHVRMDEAAALLGATADTVLDAAVAAITDRDTAALLGVLGEAIDTGVDPRRLAEDLLDRLRDLLLLASTGVLPPLAEVASADRQAGWRTAADRLGVRGLTAACEVFQTAVGSMHSGQPRITLEVAAARVLLRLADTVDVHGSLTALTQQVAALRTMSGPIGSGPTQAAAPPAAVAPAVPAPAAPAAPAAPVQEYQPPAPTQQQAPAGIVQNPGGLTAGVNHDYAPDGTGNTPLAAVGTVIDDSSTPAPAPTQAPPAPAPTQAPQPPTPAPAAPAVVPAPAPVAAPTPEAAPASFAGAEDVWAQIMEAVAQRKRATWLALRQAQVHSLTEGRIVLAANPGFEQGFRRSGHDQILLAAAADLLGGTWTVDVHGQAAA